MKREHQDMLIKELKRSERIINKLSRIARYYAGNNGTKVGRGRWDFPPLRRKERKALLADISEHELQREIRTGLPRGYK